MCSSSAARDLSASCFSSRREASKSESREWCLYVGRLPSYVEVHHLVEVFSTVGEVLNVAIVESRRSRYDTRTWSYAFVNMDYSGAMAAIAKYNGKVLFGVPMKVANARSKYYSFADDEDEEEYEHQGSGSTSRGPESNRRLRSRSPNRPSSASNKPESERTSSSRARSDGYYHHHRNCNSRKLNDDGAQNTREFSGYRSRGPATTTRSRFRSPHAARSSKKLESSERPSSSSTRSRSNGYRRSHLN